MFFVFRERFPYFNALQTNLVLGEFASIFQVKQILTIGRELEKGEVVF